MTNRSLTVERIRPFEVAVKVSIDDYVPLAVSTSNTPLAVSYYTVGTGDKSQFEITIEQTSRLVRGIVLVLFKEIADSSNRHSASLVEGLPVIDVNSIPEFRTHVDTEFTVTMTIDSVCIDWSNGATIDSITRQDRLGFLLSGKKILGAVVTGLSPQQIERLREHGLRSEPK